MRERAEQGSSAHAAAAPERHVSEYVRPSLLQAVTELGWLSPRAASLTALGRSPSSATWSALRDDPGALLLLLRLPANRPNCQGRRPSFLSLLHDSTLPSLALQQLDASTSGFVDWSSATLRPVYLASLTYARLMEHLAVCTGHADTDDAWVAGLLAPLGWFAVCAVAPGKATACLADPCLGRDPVETQLRHWGIDHAALARRIARQWNLPDWITANIGHLGLPESQALTFGADPALFHLTRLAICLAEEQGVHLGLGRPNWVAEAAEALNLSFSAARKLVQPLFVETSAVAVKWEAPAEQPLLRDVLTLAAENRRLRNVPLQLQLQDELDELQRAFEDQVHVEATRLQSAKLNALAEFAGGAGHEINNPLAVISGQAQYLINHERDWFNPDTDGKVVRALHTIIAQTKRVHALLKDLMLFARPSPAKKQWFDLPSLLGEVAASLDELALQRMVRIEVGPMPEQLGLLADAEQVRVALTCLLKNAVEAAPVEGWARLRVVEPLGEDRIEIAIEDSGSGPEAAQRDHLFDPFYSGRAAGRGRGLGLPIAWRLLRQQGGDVRLTPPDSQRPTCFVVGLPRVPAPASESCHHARNGAAVEC